MIRPVRVAVVSEFYPRAHDPVLGIWAHRQALAARDAGADVRVLVLHRPVPPRAAPSKLAALRTLLRQPRHATLDGIEIEYVPFVAPPRPRSYGSWGAWAAPPLALALRRLRRRFAFDLVHAHNAVPAGDAVRRARIGAPLVVSVHGGDVLYTAPRHGERTVRPTFERAALVLANSAGIEARARALGARVSETLHLGTDLPAALTAGAEPRTIVTVGHLVARKRHEDVLRALPPGARYLVIGDGPERPRLEALARELGADAEFTGQLAPDEALRRARRAAVFAMPSTEEAFGVAYVEAMAGGLPAVGRAGEPGPEEIAALGDGLLLATPAGLRATLERALADREALGAAARATVAEHFTWERCGAATVAAYERVLR
jgi:glycosyltransferase involved in cell wall biosynthesis